METFFPVMRRSRTSLGRPLPENSPYAVWLAYCPVCNKRLSVKKVHPKYGMPLEYERRKKQNGGGMVGKPIYCEGCGSLIHPLS